MPMPPPPPPPYPSTTTTNTDRRISPHTPHHNQRTRTGKPTASFQRPQQTCRRKKHARQRGPSNVDHLVDVVGVVVDAVRPSMAGWWSCCQCEGMNNPALSPESCTLCSHYRCQSCGNIAWCGFCWLAGFVFAFRFSLFRLSFFPFFFFGWACFLALPPRGTLALFDYTLCISRISGTPLRGSKIECFDEVVMTRNNY